VALEGIQKISDAGIPLVIIAGNHETPRIRATGSIFEALTLFPNVYAAFSNRYEKFVIQDCAFHCVPHCSLTEEMDRAFETLEHEAKEKAENKKCVLVSHGAWGGEYGMGEFNEQRLPDVEARTGVTFDYIALGHYHRYVEVQANACYSSSTERTSLNEHNSTCGYVIVDLESGRRTYHEIKTRLMRKLPVVNCAELSTSAVYEKLSELATSDLQDAIVQLVLSNIEHDVFLKLDVREIDEIFKHTLYLEKQLLRKLSESHKIETNAKIESLPVEFERFLAGIENKELDKQKLGELGALYLGTD
jgi:DNA repair exonuclease SbcCD nuclease subunit